MANSMFIPLLRLPQTLQEMRESIEEAFADLSCSRPSISRKKPSKDINNILEGFVQVEGSTLDEQCWITVSESSAEITEDEKCMYIASVTTRVDWVFAGIVSYALCRAYGAVVFNDACELDGQEKYSVKSLKEVLCDALNKKNYK